MAGMADAPGSPPSGRRKALKALWILPVVGFVALLGFASFNTSAPEPGDLAPEWTAPRLEGEGEISLSELSGKPVVMNFWASWCGPCKEEAPLLREAARLYGDDIQFVGVNIKDARTDALAWVDEWDLDFPHVQDGDRALYNEYGLTGQPETFFIDGDGIVVEHIAGPITEGSLRQMLDVLLARNA